MQRLFKLRDWINRRQDEIGPPSGRRDRRLRLERRRPESGELECWEAERLAAGDPAEALPACPAAARRNRQ